MRPWLVVGALRAELAPLVLALEGARPAGPRCVAGRLAGVPVLLLRSGVGPERAAARTAALLARREVSGVLSVGTCGALVDDLPVGSVVTAARLADEVGWDRAVLPLPVGRAVNVVTVGKPVADPAWRGRLAAAGHEACEMEAAAVARASGQRPVGVLKVVSDLAGRDPGDPLPGGRLARARFATRVLALVRDGLAPALRQVLPALEEMG